jgi:predicted phosphate transport protein (TIGR00153 family)
VKKDSDLVKEIRDEVVTLERESDKIKEEFIRNIFSKHAYLPQQTQERYQLVLHMDSIIDAAEEASRVIALGYTNEPVEEILGMAEKAWKCTDLVQDAIKYLFTDFEESMEKARKVDYVREEVRDYKFDLHKQIFRGEIKNPMRALFLHAVSRRITEVAVRAEVTADFIRALVIKYS